MSNAPRDQAILEFPAVASADTCAVWNILSSRTLSSAIKGRCHLTLAKFVLYECLDKPRKKPSEDLHLREQLRKEITSGKHFSLHELEIEDIQHLVADVGDIRRFDKGELAALALARKYRSGFITDDRVAKKVGERIVGNLCVRTTPHLVGWLVYCGHLTDGDVKTIISDNDNYRNTQGRIGIYIQQCYEHAMGLRIRPKP
ncbi:hypothetical protein [Thalassospira lucentensis]|uniref:hypothetical protein n=1 Tax=Thalassospira lucentensis TaxID=168935 RepID=UPI00142D3DA6|nr:hypothetical protein [Thalassospira lucentensis]NIZ01197.1 hypothetical protein [Thalassospira lucentensis]